MIEMYLHRKGGVYALLGSGAVQAPPGHNYHDCGRCQATLVDGKWLITRWLKPLDSDITALPSGNQSLAHFQLSKGYEVTDGAAIMVYQAQDGTLWVRLEEEFLDGRFEKLASSNHTDFGFMGDAA